MSDFLSTAFSKIAVHQVYAKILVAIFTTAEAFKISLDNARFL